MIQICKDVGVRLKINGEAVYASRPFEVFGDNAVCFTRNQGKVYTTLLDWKGGPIILNALRAGGATLGSGDFNNDLSTSDTPGDVWSCSFIGGGVSVIAPKEAGAGKIEIQIDSQSRATADLSTTGARAARQVVCEVTGLTAGKHALNIVNRGPGPVAVGALVFR